MPRQQATRRIAANVGNGLAIRDDGQLVPMTARILEQPNIRPYHGDPKWDLQQRLRYLAGLGNGRRQVIGLDAKPFNMRTASKEEIIDLMETDYGVTMDARKDHDTIRAEAIEIIKRENAADAQAEQQAQQAAIETADSKAEQMRSAAHAAAQRNEELASRNAAELAKQEREELAAARMSRQKAGGKTAAGIA